MLSSTILYAYLIVSVSSNVFAGSYSTFVTYYYICSSYSWPSDLVDAAVSLESDRRAWRRVAPPGDGKAY